MSLHPQKGRIGKGFDCFIQECDGIGIEKCAVGGKENGNRRCGGFRGGDFRGGSLLAGDSRGGGGGRRGYGGFRTLARGGGFRPIHPAGSRRYCFKASLLERKNSRESQPKGRNRGGNQDGNDQKNNEGPEGPPGADLDLGLPPARRSDKGAPYTARSPPNVNSNLPRPPPALQPPHHAAAP